MTCPPSERFPYNKSKSPVKQNFAKIISPQRLFLHGTQNTPRHTDPIGRRLLEPAGHGRAVADGAQSGDAGLEVAVHDHFVGVEFHLHAVEQRDVYKSQVRDCAHLFRSILLVETKNKCETS